MTKAEFIDQVVKTSEEMDLTKKAAGELIDSIFNIVGRAIKKDGRFSYPGFGTFTMKKRAARKGRNPRTGTEIRIKASKTVGFKYPALAEWVLAAKRARCCPFAAQLRSRCSQPRLPLRGVVRRPKGLRKSS